jgi:hypothetical protein
VWFVNDNGKVLLALGSKAPRHDCMCECGAQASRMVSAPDGNDRCSSRSGRLTPTADRTGGFILGLYSKGPGFDSNPRL